LPSDQTLLARTPTTQGSPFARCSSTIVGPSPTLSLPIVACFLFTAWPREVVALTGAGVLLTSRRLHSRQMLGLVDWELLVLFIGLFVVNHALQKTGLPERVVTDLAVAGVPLQHLGPLFAITFVLSNIVSNVPAVMLLLPSVAHTLAGPTLALVSALAGNLLIVGSVANIIVVDAAGRRSDQLARSRPHRYPRDAHDAGYRRGLPGAALVRRALTRRPAEVAA